jgi:hypothetical protein
MENKWGYQSFYVLLGGRKFGQVKPISHVFRRLPHDGRPSETQKRTIKTNKPNQHHEKSNSACFHALHDFSGFCPNNGYEEAV